MIRLEDQKATMARHTSVMFGWSWTEASGLSSRVPWFSQHPTMQAALWHSDLRLSYGPESPTKYFISWILRCCTAGLHYNGNYNRKNLWKQKKFIWGTKSNSYELLFYPHIEEGQTKVVCCIKKINLIKKNLRNWGFKIFAVTMELHFLIKQTTLVWPFLFVGEIWAHMNGV